MTLKSEEMNELQEICNKNTQNSIITIGVILGFDVVLGLEILSEINTYATFTVNFNLNLGMACVVSSMIFGIITIVYYQINISSTYYKYYTCREFTEEIHEKELIKTINLNGYSGILSIFIIVLFFVAFLSLLLKNESIILVLISIFSIIFIVIFYTMFEMKKNMNLYNKYKKELNM